MKQANAKYEGAAESQLHPTGVGDFARHLIGDYHGTERINSRGDRVQNQESSEVAYMSKLEMGAEQRSP